MRFALSLMLSLIVGFAFAVTPEERLADPVLEERARNVSKELRCVVCQNQSIDDSDASVARDMRRVVRERIVAGDDDAAVLDFLVARYGEYVLLRPRWELATIVLWTTPLLLLAGALVFFRRAATQPSTRLSDAEEKRLRDLL